MNEAKKPADKPVPQGAREVKAGVPDEPPVATHRPRPVVASEFKKAEAEHTAACDRMRLLANRRMVLLIELKRIDEKAANPVTDPATESPS